MSNKNTINNWQKSLKLISECPVCNKIYGQKSSKKFIDRDGSHLVHVTCHKCQAYFLAIIMEIGRGSSLIGLVTDLSFNDVSRLYGQNKITLDEVINSHKFIFSKQFNKKVCQNIN